MDFNKQWIRENIHLIEPGDQQIPKNLHMIWVGDKEMPDYVIPHLNKWKNLMPDWNIRLWGNDDIRADEFPEEIIVKINESTIGAQKSDIMRYFIIEKYGGFYVDTDTIPYRSLTPLTQMGFQLIVYHDNDLTWEYVINCVFGAIPHHPVLKRACELIHYAKLNTTDVHFQTGPHLWGKAIAGTSSCGKKYGLLYHSFFNNHDYFDGKYGSHTYARSWINN